MNQTDETNQINGTNQIDASNETNQTDKIDWINEIDQTNKKSDNFQQRPLYPYVEWKEAMGFRNVLIHAYFGIDLEAVWDTIRNNIPSLKENILEILESEKKAEKNK